jgi:hypothetical protein
MTPEEIASLIERVRELEADKARLDFLDECNRRLNSQSGSKYGWRLILNHNVNRLMSGHLSIDLHDSEGGSHKLSSCRAAIDERMSDLRRASTNNQEEVAEMARDAEFLRDFADRLFRNATPAMGFDQGDTDQLHRIASALISAQPQEVVVPDGWVMMPREMTAEMISAWRNAPGLDILTAYRAMIAAAPKEVK